MICNDWITASYLQDKVDMRKGYFIVYHSHENDIKELSDVVVSTYHKWHNIIVTNETIRKKFDLDKRTTIIPAIDANKISDENNELRKANFVLIPLRKNPIKGAEYAIEAIDLLLRERSDITICTFGDYNLSHPVNSKWKHLGIVTDEVLVSLFREAEVLVSPSVEDWGRMSRADEYPLLFTPSARYMACFTTYPASIIGGRDIRNRKSISFSFRI